MDEEERLKRVIEHFVAKLKGAEGHASMFERYLELEEAKHDLEVYFYRGREKPYHHKELAYPYYHTVSAGLGDKILERRRKDYEANKQARKKMVFEE